MSSPTPFLYEFMQRYSGSSLGLHQGVTLETSAVRPAVAPPIGDDSQTGRAHLLLISRTPGKPGGAIGVLTLEDISDEILSEEIVNETDQYSDNMSTQQVKRITTAAVMQRFREFTLEALTTIPTMVNTPGTSNRREEGSREPVKKWEKTENWKQAAKIVTATNETNRGQQGRTISDKCENRETWELRPNEGYFAMRMFHPAVFCPWEYAIIGVTKRDDVTFLLPPNDTVFRRSLSTPSLDDGSPETQSWLFPSGCTSPSFSSHQISIRNRLKCAGQLSKIWRRHFLMHFGLPRGIHAANGAHQLNVDEKGQEYGHIRRPSLISTPAHCHARDAGSLRGPVVSLDLKRRPAARNVTLGAIPRPHLRSRKCHRGNQWIQDHAAALSATAPGAWPRARACTPSHIAAVPALRRTSQRHSGGSLAGWTADRSASPRCGGAESGHEAVGRRAAAGARVASASAYTTHLLTLSAVLSSNSELERNNGSNAFRIEIPSYAAI
ncbi:hypothetical protein B0H13DRAFT_2529895 [Mycena leptocephala]|nr:hypothetical protein B0H13DRAFT_2529895 [Mycena leptocephala]